MLRFPELYIARQRVNFTAQRIVAPVNSNLNSPQRVVDRPNDDRSTPAFIRPFHSQGVAHGQTEDQRGTSSVFRK